MMKRHMILEEGQLLKYIGDDFETFDRERPFARFLGYDCNGWKELWIEHQGKQIHVRLSDIEVISE